MVLGTGSDLGGWRVEAGTVEAVGTFWQAAEGTVSIDLSGIYDQAGTISQEVATVPGHRYQLSFSIAGNPGAPNDFKKPMQILWNDEVIAHLEPDIQGQTFANMGWKRYVWEVVATGTAHKLKFQSLTFNPFGPTLDGVKLVDLTPVADDGFHADIYLGVQLTGNEGATYRVETRRDEIQKWQALTNVVLSSPRMLWIDPIPAHDTQRFYRAVEVR